MNDVTPLPNAAPEAPADSIAPGGDEPEAIEKTLHRIEEMPRDVGWLLVTAGVIGEIAPGVMGTPFWIVGTLILWPSMGKRVESWLEARAPKLLNGGMRQVGRFLDDLDRRYPIAKTRHESNGGLAVGGNDRVLKRE